MKRCLALPLAALLTLSSCAMSEKTIEGTNVAWKACEGSTTCETEVHDLVDKGLLTASDDADGDGVIDESEYAVAKKRIEVEEKEKAIESSRASESRASESRASESRASASRESEYRASEQAERQRQQQQRQQQQEPTQRPQQQAPQPQQSQYQWPSVPYQPGQGMEWFTKGPFQSEWTCDQDASTWPADTSYCFEGPDGYAYYYALRQAAR